MIIEESVIIEIWQAFSTLSDAQDMLEIVIDTGHPDAADDRINHAKAHLKVLIDKTMAEDPDGFLRAVMTSMTCTLTEGGEEGHRVKP